MKRVLVRSGEALGVQARGGDGSELVVHSPVTVIAAGTLHTPSLLARSGLGLDSGQLGRNLSLHPATAAFGLMDHVVDMARGVPQSFYIDEFAREGILFEGVAGPPSYVAMALPMSGRRHQKVMARYRNLAQFGLMVSDSSRGRLQFMRSRPMIRYDLDRADLEKFRRGISLLDELLRAAGAREVYLPLPGSVRPPERAGATSS